MSDEMYEQERLSKLLCEFSGSTAEELAEAVRTGVRNFTGGAPQADDITMVVLHFKGPAAVARPA